MQEYLHCLCILIIHNTNTQTSTGNNYLEYTGFKCYSVLLIAATVTTVSIGVSEVEAEVTVHASARAASVCCSIGVFFKYFA